MALQNILEQMGLTQKQAAVYLAALELAEAPALQIARKAGIKRPTAYVALASLQEEGFIEIVPKGGSTLYRAVDPDKLLNKFQEKIDAFKSSLPELRSILNVSPTKPRVRFYEGRNAILSLYETQIFGKKKDIIGVVSIKDVRKILSRDQTLGMLHLMKANDIRIRDILERSAEAEEYFQEKNRLGVGETRSLPENLGFDIDMLVYENTVAMISPKALIAVVIEDAAISSAQRQFLEFLWKTIV